MDWVFELIDAIPLLVELLAPGYLFMSLYSWMRFSVPMSSQKLILIKSVVVSYILTKLYALLLGGFGLDATTEFLITCGAGVVLGYIAARCVGSHLLTYVLLKFRILRSTNEYIWDDILVELQKKSKKARRLLEREARKERTNRRRLRGLSENQEVAKAETVSTTEKKKRMLPGVWICAYHEKEERYYIGQHAYSENRERFPLIALKNYFTADKERNIVYNEVFDNANTVVMLNMADCSNVSYSLFLEDFGYDLES